MALTKEEKKVFVLPVLLALVLLGIVGYNWHMRSHGREVQERISMMTNQIRANRLALQTLETMQEKEKARLTFTLDEWVPVLQNPLEVKLFLSEKMNDALTSVGAVQKEWEVGPSGPSKRPHLCECSLQALFPSYAALVHFLQRMEEGIPPLLPQRTEIKKDGLYINVSLTMLFAYRIKDEAV